ncbi:unnamed protein product [Brassica oleracea var. botrytis]|uniref:(rape) hypothetical protein n=1 Tax=Brassica napus TaxID=3708 RepID=A0A816Q7W6_BRANA|nr:unnamed protein product [Brassica napus]
MKSVQISGKSPVALYCIRITLLTSRTLDNLKSNYKVALSRDDAKVIVNTGVKSRKGARKDPKIGYEYVYYDQKINNILSLPATLNGYPGAVSNTPTYILMSETTMELNMEASAENKNTPINLAQNTYWNLVDNDSWNILDHMIQIWGPHITHVDQHTDHARSLRERDLLSLSPQEMDRRVYKRGGYRI